MEIAFIGRNWRHTLESFRRFIANNLEQFKIFDYVGGVAVMRDGTKIFAVGNRYRILGRRFDQVILSDCPDWLLFREIEHMATGRIPFEFFIQFYKD